ncbi:MAG: MG2 domain-containing protein [Thermoproteota archaeon]
MNQSASASEEEHEIVIELTLRKLVILILLIIPVILLVYIGAELMSAYYGPRNLITDFSLDKESYKPSDWVTVSVSVSSGSLGGLIKMPARKVVIGIEVRNPKGNVIYINQGETDFTGSLKFQFRIPREAEIGEYTVYVACSGSSQSRKLRVEP